MEINFGSGPPLKEFSPWLKNDAERRQRILTVAETNSIIEGLPPFTQEMRQRLLSHLAQFPPPEPVPEQSSPSSDRSDA